MLPIVDKPVIQYVVEELVASGITDIIIVTGWHKRAIEDHFDYPGELINLLEQQKKYDLLDEVKRTAELANFIYIRQKGPYGNGTPVLCAKSVIGDEPFVAIWGDEFIYSKPPRTRQCIEVFEKYGDPVISAVRVPKADVSRYGIVEATNVEKMYGRSKIIGKAECGGSAVQHGGPRVLRADPGYFSDFRTSETRARRGDMAAGCDKRTYENAADLCMRDSRREILRYGK